MKKLKLCILAILVMTSFKSNALDDNKLKQILVASGWGTLIGAGVGAASLAITDDPGSKLVNIAKGASLGLYVGVGVGFYLNSGSSALDKSQDVQQDPLTETIFFIPQFHLGKIQGAEVHFVSLRF